MIYKLLRSFYLQNVLLKKYVPYNELSKCSTNRNNMTPCLVNLFSSSNIYYGEDDLTSNELKLVNLLKTRFSNASDIHVEDISGGCGSMYEVWVESNDFKNLSIVKQHKLVTETLKEEIKDMHGVRINTSIPRK